MTRRGPLRAAWSRLRRIRWRRVAFASAALFALALAGTWVAAHLVPLPERLAYRDSVVATYRGGRPAHALLSKDDKWRFPTRLRDVDPAYVKALLALEDRRFRYHPGVDPIAIARAAWQNLWAGSVESGASTITMQLARLLEPRPRTFRSKLVEAFRAFQLEVHMSKDEILEAYMRFAPYGGNLEGIEAASQAFWGRSPAGLSAPEIATLLAIPQRPGARRPSPDNRDALRDARDRIARHLADEGAIPNAGRPEALAESLNTTEVPLGAESLPRDIPHVVRWLKRHRPQAFAQDEPGRKRPAVRIETTLEERTQRRISEIAAAHSARLRARGAPHAAVVVLEADTGRVRGIVGNLNFDPDEPGSTLPAFSAPRSTGSLLKPVAYAAALDEGLLAPSHLLLDVPMVRGEYRPENFDRQYLGLVEAEKALSLSRNIPFVRLVERLGVDALVQTMVRFELEGPARRAGDGGLELAIGGMPATAFEVASLYAGLARGGRPVTPKIYALDAPADAAAPTSRDRPAGAPHFSFSALGDLAESAREGGDGAKAPPRALSRAASWLTARALTRRPHPRAPVGPRRARDEAFVWKTGTSYAYHDAWTAGFGERYALAVWTGDLAYERHPELVGARAAAPLFFEILRAIDEPAPLGAKTPREELAEIEVCARSGRRAGPHCPHSASALVPARTAAPETCPFHDEVRVDSESGRRLPAGCVPEDVGEVEMRVVTRLPEAFARFQRARGRRVEPLPEIHPECRDESDARLSITSPREGASVVLESDRPARRQKLRLEAYSAAGAEIHWYIDGKHHASADADRAVYWVPEPGRFSIAAVDARGHRDVRELSVEGEAAELGEREP